MIGGDEYLSWFQRIYDKTISRGNVWGFVVGQPGAGKSHFLNYLDYLFYKANQFNGVYIIYEATRQEITERNLWLEIFSNEESAHRIRNILTPSYVSNFSIRSDMKYITLEYLKGYLDFTSLDDRSLHDFAKNLCALLLDKKIAICIGIDNVDENFRYIEDKYGKEKAIQKLFGTLRSLSTGIKQIVLLLACTTPVYTTIETIRRDRTYTRRIEFQNKSIGELTLTQCRDLVYKYLDVWAKNRDLILPDIKECQIPTSEGQKSVYPFTKVGIEYFYNGTSKFAGDIVALCSGFISYMKENSNVSIFKDDILIDFLEKISGPLKDIVPRMLEIISNERFKIKKELMRKKMIDIERRTLSRYGSYISEKEKIIAGIEAFANVLGVSVSPIEEVENYYNPSRYIQPNELLKIWRYKDNHIAVKYILGDSPPIIKTYSKKIELSDVFDVGSLIEGKMASNGLFLQYLSGGFSVKGGRRSARNESWKFDPVLETISLDEVMIKIVGVLEEGGQDIEDLMIHIDQFYLELTSRLDGLIRRKRPPEPTPEDRRRKLRQQERGIGRERAREGKPLGKVELIQEETKVLIDGANVAYHNVSKGKKPCFKNIRLAYEYYQTKGYKDVKVYCEARLRHIIDQRDEFQKKLDKHTWLRQTKKGEKADVYLLKWAVRFPNTIVVSNDSFDKPQNIAVLPEDEKDFVRRNKHRFKGFDILYDEFVEV